MSTSSTLDAGVHYTERGCGEPVLLIHGLGATGAIWTFQTGALERRFRLIIPDLPGSGGSPVPREGFSIAGFARTLWQLLDHLHASPASIVGFSLGGAVALEMSLQRPEQVKRLALINSLASYHIDHWRKWLEAWGSIALVRVLGMRLAAALLAARMFPRRWQSGLRRQAALMMGAATPRATLRAAHALLRWTATDRLQRHASRTLLIAGEYDYMPLVEKRALAAQLRAALVVVRGSRHGTPFDSIQATNASLLALLTDQPLPACDWLSCDPPSRSQAFLDGILGEGAQLRSKSA